MNTNRLRTVLVLLLIPLVAAPTIANASGFFSLRVGSAGGGFAVGSTDWAIYGASWHDSSWGISYESHLAGYGEWVRVDGIGRVWRPWVAPGWRPYTHGRWAWTDVGWTWIAYEPWGYVPHHYGNWALTTFGWVWAPGWTYRPATVSWVTCGSYVGWFPTAPHGWVHSERAYRHGWNSGYRSGYDNGYRDGWHDARYATWVPWGNIGDDNLSRHAVRYENVSHSHSAPPTRIIAAPDRADVVRRGVSVPHTTLERRTVSAGDRRITVARPKGMTRSVETHGEDTVRHALSTRVSTSPRERKASQATTPRVSSARSNPGDRTATVRRSSTGGLYGSSDQRQIQTRDDRSTATSRTQTRIDASRSHRNPSEAPAVEREKRESVRTQPIAHRGDSREHDNRFGDSSSRYQPRSDRSQARRPAEEDRRDRSLTQPPPTANRSSSRPAQQTNRERHQTVAADHGRRQRAKSDRRSPQSRSPKISGEAVIHPAPRGDTRQSTRRQTDTPPADPKRKSPRTAGKRR